MSIEPSTEDILRERLKEYRELLELCYNAFAGPELQDTTRYKIMEALNDHGIGAQEQRPLNNKDEQ